MGAPPDPEQMVNMLSNPQFASTMNEALQNPQILDMMIQQNPMLRNVPGARQMMQSPEFRRMMTDPDTIRSMSQMGRAMGMGGMGGMGGNAAGGAGGFPAPGVTDTTPAGTDGQGAGSTQTQGSTDDTGNAAPNPFAMFGNPGAAGAANPLAALFGNGAMGEHNPAGSPAAAGQVAANPDGQNPAANPFAALFNPAAFAQAPGATGTEPNAQQTPQANPFLANNPLLQNPQAMQQMLAAMTGGMGAGGAGAEGAGGLNPAFAGNPFAAFGGASPPPADTRPPEERYAEQLRQLNDMGFYEFERNVEALRRSGGSVRGAVEYLLTH